MRFAIGDPQAPIERFFEILDRAGLLGDDGRLRPEVFLVSIGDHFDWGPIAAREAATRGGLQILSWLAAHPSDQVVLLAGNHDLARVGELAHFDAEAFARARAEADHAYRFDRSAEAGFLARHPQLPTAELLSRDYSCFSVEQRSLVERLLRSGRLRLAHAEAHDLLLVHAGVTCDDLAPLDLPSSELGDARSLAQALNGLFDRSVAAWQGGPLALEPLHRPGDGRRGEGRGILYHRPSHPERVEAELLEGPPRRRFDPRALPAGLTQVVGHVRDAKCRSLLGPWGDGELPEDGPVRQLVTDGREVRYGRRTGRRSDGEAAMVFIDGGMACAPVDRYELFDLNRRSGTAR